jgi:hypothetical protein
MSTWKKHSRRSFAFTNLLQDGTDPVTALRRHLLPDSRYRALVWDVIGAGVAASLGRIIESV